MPCNILPDNTAVSHYGLSMTAKERLYLVRWLSDGEQAVMSGLQKPSCIKRREKTSLI